MLISKIIQHMDIDLKEVVRLLKIVDSYEAKRSEIERIYENSGIRYNIFDVLKLSTSEVRLHSSIIASLLQSDRHGAKSGFLKEFLRIPTLNLKDGFLDISKTSVEVEKYIGQCTDSTGGRIDIFITDESNSLIIENKIYARDQHNQLLRYHNFKPDGKLVYLTLYGDMPNEESLGSLSLDDITILSYRDDIIPWLERCVQLASTLPYVRETINQYINILKQLTNSDMATNDDIIKLIGQPDNICAAFAISENLNAYINEAMNSFLVELKKKLNDLPFKCITEEDQRKDWWNCPSVQLQFVHQDWKTITFAVQFEGKNLSNMAIGLLKKEDCEDIRNVSDANELAQRLGYSDKKNKYWFWGYPNQFRYWNNGETIKKLMDGSMVEWFLDRLKNADEQSKGLTL